MKDWRRWICNACMGRFMTDPRQGDPSVCPFCDNGMIEERE